MTNVAISGLPGASSLTGSEIVPVVQGVVTKKTTAQEIANLAPGATASILVESGASAKISVMSAAGSLAGTESIPAVQSGGNVKATAQAIANLAPAAILVESGAAAKTSALSAGSALAGTEAIAIVQSGATVKTTAQAIANLADTGLAVTTQSGSSYTAVIGDANSWINFTNGSANGFVVPTNASVPFIIGTTIIGRQAGGGVVTVSGAGGVTLQSAGSLVNTNGQYATFSVTKMATNTWALSGNLT